MRREILNLVDQSDRECSVSRIWFSLSPGDVSKVTKEVDQDDLVIALKNASPELKKIIYSTMSKRAVEALEEQLSFLGPKRLSEVESAQDRVIQIVRELEEDEEIILDTGGSDVVVQ